jgi:hypothetical protein
MRKVVYVVGGLAFFFVVALIGIVLYLVTKSELEFNRNKTAAARAKRWERNGSINLEGKSEAEINDALDKLNETKPENNESQV